MNAPPQPATRWQIFCWTLFDFANTGFYVIIITLVFPIYFKNVIAGGNEAYWGRTISASMLITAVLGPFLGSVADATSRKKMLLAIFTGACVISTAGLYCTGQGTLWAAVTLLIVANVGFEGGTVFYDAFLPEISTQKNYARISGYGFAVGYLGSFATLLIILPILSHANAASDNVRVTFLIAAAFFAFFALPLFLFLHEHRQRPSRPESFILAGYERLKNTVAHIRQYNSIERFLVAFFVYNDSILTVIFFSGIFAEHTLGLTLEELVYFFLLVQGSALLGSVAFGVVTNRLGPRQVIGVTLLIWLAVVGAAYTIQSKEAFFLLGAVAGIALGSSQSTSRTMMALLTPFEKRAEFFGFYDGFFGKASAVVGPLIFGEVSHRFGQRPAILTIGGLLAVGLLLLFRVPDVRPAGAGIVEA